MQGQKSQLRNLTGGGGLNGNQGFSDYFLA